MTHVFGIVKGTNLESLTFTEVQRFKCHRGIEIANDLLQIKKSKLIKVWKRCTKSTVGKSGKMLGYWAGTTVKHRFSFSTFSFSTSVNE